MEWLAILISLAALVLSFLAYRNSKNDRLQDLRMKVRATIDMATELLKILPKSTSELGSGTNSLLAAKGQLHSGHREKEDREREEIFHSVGALSAEIEKLDQELSNLNARELEHHYASAQRLLREAEGLSELIGKKERKLEQSQRDYREDKQKQLDRVVAGAAAGKHSLDK